jgi:hypothetical protein
LRRRLSVSRCSKLLPKTDCPRRIPAKRQSKLLGPIHSRSSRGNCWRFYYCFGWLHNRSLALHKKTLWEITDDTLKHAQETSKKELRAYVGVEPAGISRYIKRPEDGPEEILGHFIIHNVGNVPAKRVSIFSTIEWSEDGERRTFNNCSVQDSPTVLQHGVRCSSEQGEGSLLKR